MPVPDSFRDRVMTDLEPLGDIRARAMFGGYGIFEDGDMFGLMSGSVLFFKIGEGNRAAFEAVGAEQFNRCPTSASRTASWTTRRCFRSGLMLPLRWVMQPPGSANARADDTLPACPDSVQTDT